MSNTVITSYVDVSGSISKTGKQLVLLVNKDGTLSLEKNVLQSLLDETNPENVSVSLVHVNEDGKPKNIVDESGSDNEDDVPHVNLTVNAFYDSKANECSKNDLQDEICADAMDLFRLSFQNDHCYTPHTLPDEESVCYEPSVALNVVNSKSNIPSSKKVTILENKIIPKGKKIINLSTSEGQVYLKRSDILKKIAEAQRGSTNTTSIISSSIITGTLDKNLTAPPPTDVITKSSPNIAVTEPVTLNKSSTSFQNEYIKNLSQSAKQNINKNVKSLLTKKIESRKVTSSSGLEISDVPEPTRRTTFGVRNYGKDNNEKLASGRKLKKSTMSLDKDRESQSSENIILSQSVGKVDKGDGSKLNKPPAKKKPPAHMTALLDDMTSLFSTPDVLRRVSTDAKSPNLVRKSGDVESEDTSLLHKTEVRTYSKARNVGAENLSQIFQDANESLLQGSINDLSHMHGSDASSMNVPLSPSLDILGGIQAEEEGLSEDFLMHVARLVESSEKLQEVIDNQVLGKVDDIQTKEIIPPAQTILPQVENIQAERRPTTPVTRREPVQIVRSNGRVITLPPIEAPATRASKRKSLLNASLDQPAPTAVIINTPTPSVAIPVATPVIPPVPPKSGAATSSSSKKPHKLSDKQQTPTLQPDVEDEENVESDESWNSEDDPDRLWCICKQPHNNRFMICCDMCEDWFHGKCVNITKSMGQEMEEKGVEWRCPTCVKKKNLGKFPFKPSSPRKSVESKSEALADNEAYSHLNVTLGKSAATHSSTSCIVCKKVARPSSIYCSDACILKHAQESLNITSPPVAGLKQNVTSVKDDVRVIVYERKSGKCLAGPSAPTAANLKTWLKENPTFEVVRPGTIPSKQSANTPRSKSGAQKIQSVLKIGDDKQIMLVQPHKSQPQGPVVSKTSQPTSSTLTTKSLTSKANDQVKSSTEQSPKLSLKIPTPKQVTKTYVKTPTTPKTPSQQKQPALKSPTTPVGPRKEDNKSKSSSGTDPIRENVRKTLREQLSIRMAETKNINFSSEEISKFAISTEHELHDLFKDVGVKYKAKYRSLMFNLKDRKNLSLWQKICDRLITPKQLVRLSPEELASQELAQWRDQEAKHQLELIKKSELDLLACNKTYVLKTHKGEEVIESKSLPTTELDPNVTLDDIVSALNHSTEEESKDEGNNEKVREKKSRDDSSPSLSPSRHRKYSQHSSSHHKHSRRRSRSRSRSSRNKRDHSSDKHKSSSKHESARDSKSSSRSHHKKSSSEKTKVQSDRHSDSLRHSSRSETRHGSSSHSGGHHSSSKSKSKSDHDKHTSATKRSRSRDGSRTRRSRSKESRRLSSSKDHDKSSSEVKHKSSPKESDKKHHKRRDSRSKSRDKLVIDEKLILKAAEDTDILLPHVENVDVASPPSPGAPQASANLIEGESDQEPSSTVDSTQSPLWNGSIGMIDVAKFNVSMYEVSGVCDILAKDLRSELEIVGRIQPETVWDYVDKMKKQTNKEIILTKILPAEEGDHTQHSIFYNYLNSRNRLGVVKAHGGCIKDFYILPLPSHTPIPSVLLPLKGPGFEEFRPNVLLGIIVGQKRKRSLANTSTIPTKVSKLREKEERSYTPPVGSYTPPRSPAPAPPSYPLLPTLSSTVKHQIAASLACADDEPYSPGDSDSVSRSPTDLHKKMQELDRKIEERKKQIQSIAGNITSGDVLDEPYSPSRPVSPESGNKATIPGLSDISLPSNLQEILATIHQKTASSVECKPPPVEEPYIPTAINVDVNTVSASLYYKESPSGDVDMRLLGKSFNQVHATAPVYPPGGTSEKTTSSKLSSLSEAELLSMVPDNELFPPLPPLPTQDMSVPPPPYKRMRVDTDQPPPPGLEDDVD